jgi:hypothetical protein
MNNEWHKASASNGQGNCVEVRRDGDHVLVRDTKTNGAGPINRFTREEWSAFLDGARRGEFDLS